MKAGRKELWTASLVVSIAGAIGFFAYPRTTKPRPAEYVESATCASCHRDIWETYRKTGMGRSFSHFRPSVERFVWQRLLPCGVGAPLQDV